MKRRLARGICLIVVFLFSSQSQAKPESLKLAFVGDILLAGQAGRIMQSRGTSYPLAKVAPILKRADLAFGNLECVLTGNTITRNVRVSGKKLFIFKTPPRFGKALVDGGIDVVSLANNHTMNGGKAGLIETMETLKKLGITYVGAGQNAKEARACRIIKVKGRKIVFLAYADIGGGDGVAILKNTLRQVLEEVKAAKRKADLLVVSFHWGIEGSTKPSSRQKTIAYQIIDAGADMVIGHHPHVLQPIEVYKSKTIAYSLGNFVFDNPRPICSRTMILWIEVDEDNKQKIKQIFCKIKNAQPWSE